MNIRIQIGAGVKAAVLFATLIGIGWGFQRLVSFPHHFFLFLCPQLMAIGSISPCGRLIERSLNEKTPLLLGRLKTRMWLTGLLSAVLTWLSIYFWFERRLVFSVIFFIPLFVATASHLSKLASEESARETGRPRRYGPMDTQMILLPHLGGLCFVTLLLAKFFTPFSAVIAAILFAGALLVSHAKFDPLAVSAGVSVATPQQNGVQGWILVLVVFPAMFMTSYTLLSVPLGLILRPELMGRRGETAIFAMILMASFLGATQITWMIWKRRVTPPN